MRVLLEGSKPREVCFEYIIVCGKDEYRDTAPFNVWSLTAADPPKEEESERERISKNGCQDGQTKCAHEFVA